VLLQSVCLSQCPFLHYPYKGVCQPCRYDCPTPLMFTMLNITQANTTLVGYLRLTGTIPATLKNDINKETFSMMLKPTNGDPDVHTTLVSVSFTSADTIQANFTLPKGTDEIVFVPSLSVNNPALFTTKVSVTQNIHKFNYTSEDLKIQYQERAVIYA
jgi:hypothetical protein